MTTTGETASSTISADISPLRIFAAPLMSNPDVVTTGP
jgi:hypothetical protein